MIPHRAIQKSLPFNKYFISSSSSSVSVNSGLALNSHVNEAFFTVNSAVVNNLDLMEERAKALMSQED